MKCSSILLPQVVVIPLVQMLSLTAIGTPARVPSFSPLERLESMDRAVANAASSFTSKKLFTLGSLALIASRKALVIVSALASPFA